MLLQVSVRDRMGVSLTAHQRFARTSHCRGEHNYIIIVIYLLAIVSTGLDMYAKTVIQ